MTTTLRLGDVEVQRVGLGTNRLTPTPQNVAFIRETIGAGIQHIDTAHLYTGGGSETTIGEALSPKAPDVVVATKGGFGGPGQGRPEVLREQVEASFQRLRTEVIDLYYLHRVDPDTPIEESLGVIKEYHDAGRIRAVGVSEVSIEMLERARAVVPITAVQNEYNTAERKYDDVINHCEREGIVFVPFYPLRGELGAAAAEVARRHGATDGQLKLAWLLKRSPVLLPIPGTLSLEHARENLAALDIDLSDEEFAALAEG